MKGISLIMPDEDIVIHPFFASNNEWVAILPLHWKTDRIRLKYDSIIVNHSFADDVLCFDHNNLHNTITIRKTNLPSVFINTESKKMDSINSSVDHSYGENGEIWLVDSIGLNYYGNVFIRGRGNFTWRETKEKKPYSIKLFNKTELLDLNPSNKYNLLSNPYDRSNLKNAIVYEFAKTVHIPYTPKFEFISLFLNGDYNGLYMITNKIGVSKSNIDLPQMEKANKTCLWTDTIQGKLIKGGSIMSADDITGTYLLDHGAFDNKESGFISNNDIEVTVRHPEFASKEEIEYIRSYYNEMDNAIAAENGINTNTGKHILDYIDLESFVQYYVFQEFFANFDAGRNSFLMYKKKDEDTGKMYAGPLWDFDTAITPGNNIGLITAESFFVKNGFINHPFKYKGMLGELCKHEFFMKAAIDYYKYIFSPQIEMFLKSDVLNNLLKKVEKENYYDYLIHQPYLNSIPSEPSDIISFITNRKRFLDEEWINKTRKSYSVYLDGAPINTSLYHLVEYRVEKDSVFQLPSRLPPPVKMSENLFFSGWVDEKGNKVSYIRVQKNSRFYATWKKKEFSIKQRLRNTLYNVLN